MLRSSVTARFVVLTFFTSRLGFGLLWVSFCIFPSKLSIDSYVLFYVRGCQATCEDRGFDSGRAGRASKSAARSNRDAARKAV